MTYFQEIEDIIKTHPEIHTAIVGDVIYRSRCWLENEETTPDDNYIKRQRDYLMRWIK